MNPVCGDWLLYDRLIFNFGDQTQNEESALIAGSSCLGKRAYEDDSGPVRKSQETLDDEINIDYFSGQLDSPNEPSNALLENGSEAADRDIKRLLLELIECPVELPLFTDSIGSVRNANAIDLVSFALKNNDEVLLESLLNDKRIDPNNLDGKGASFFHVLYHEKDQTNLTPLSTNSLKSLNYLLRKPNLDPNARAKDESTLLHLMVKEIHSGRMAIEHLRSLLNDPRIDPNLRDSFGNTPLHYLAQQQCDWIIEAIKLFTPLHRLAIDQKNFNDETPLELSKSFIIFKELLANYSDDSLTPELRKKIIASRLSTESNLLAKRIPNHNLNDIERAVLFGQLHIVNRLLNNGSVNDFTRIISDGDTFLHLLAKHAIRKSSLALEALERILISNNRFAINIKNSIGDTPLHCVLKGCKSIGCKNIKQFILNLISYETFNPNIQNREGQSVLHLAVKAGDAGAIYEVLSKIERLDPNITDLEGRTPFHLVMGSAKKNQIRNFFEYFKKKFDISVQDNNGNTAFHSLAKSYSRNKWTIIKELIRDQGELVTALSRLKDANGKTVRNLMEADPSVTARRLLKRIPPDVDSGSMRIS